MVSKKNSIPEDQLRAVYTTKQLERGKRLSDYGMQSESNVFLILRLLGGSMTSIPPEKVLDDAVELCDAPDMITWDDDPENKRAKMPCGHAISKEVPFCPFLPLSLLPSATLLQQFSLTSLHHLRVKLGTRVRPH